MARGGDSECPTSQQDVAVWTRAVPSALERELLALYELTLPLSVNSVLTSERASVDAWLPSDSRRPAEQLVVRQDGANLDIALYLDAAVLECLARDDPHRRLHEGNLQEFLFALEGVSHFVCLAWNAQFDRAVSALELELQAEVDKFLLSYVLHERQSAADGNALLARLFDQVHFAPDLDADESRRYADANRYARRYCARLLERLPRLAQRAELLRELRRFYRLSPERKLRHIGAR